LLKFTQDENGVTAEVKNQSGEYETIEARYLIGCDGAHSLVRHTLGIEFGGSTFERIFYVADVELDWAFGHDALTVNLGKNTLTAFFPMSGEQQWRIVGTFPEGHNADEGEVLFDEIEKQVFADTELKFDITKVNWFSTYKVHSRHVNKFSEGRCFLAGDAAHIHTPAGAQGMNTGIQDAVSLADPLLHAMSGDRSQLLGWADARQKVARSVVRLTDRMTRLATLRSPAGCTVRNGILSTIGRISSARNAIARRIAGLDH